MEDYKSEILEYISKEILILNELDIEAVNEALNLIVSTLDKKSAVYIFGNGGSAATASHFQNDFNKGLSECLEKKFDFRCLNDNIATVMAIANDIGFEEVFRFQLQGRLQENDVIVAISGSGNSRNVLYAVEYAKEEGCKVIALTGYDGGKLAKLADISLNVPVESMQITEDIHMIYDHLMMSVLYKRF